MKNTSVPQTLSSCESILLRFLPFVLLGALISMPQSVCASGASSHAAFVADAKRRLTRDFKDPGSAQFRNTYLTTDKGTAVALCGEVNAKNSFGAYTGFRPFYVMDTGKSLTAGVMEDGAEDIVFNTIFKGACSGKRTPVR